MKNIYCSNTRELCDLNSSTKTVLTDELSSFGDTDRRVRNIIETTSRFSFMQERLDSASICMHNRIMNEVRVSNEKGILFPVNYLVISDLLVYLEEYYFYSLEPHINVLNGTLEDINKLNMFKKLLYRKQLIDDVFEKRSELIDCYNDVTNYIYDFDMSKEGYKVYESALKSVEPEQYYKIAEYHKRYHQKMGNTLVLSQIK